MWTPTNSIDDFKRNRRGSRVRSLRMAAFRTPRKLGCQHGIRFESTDRKTGVVKFTIRGGFAILAVGNYFCFYLSEYMTD